MEKEDIIALANLLTTMKDYTPKLKKALERKDSESLAKLKKEILALSSSINQII